MNFLIILEEEEEKEEDGGEEDEEEDRVQEGKKLGAGKYVREEFTKKVRVEREETVDVEIGMNEKELQDKI